MKQLLMLWLCCGGMAGAVRPDLTAMLAQVSATPIACRPLYTAAEWNKLSPASRNAVACGRLRGTISEATKRFTAAYKTSISSSFAENENAKSVAALVKSRGDFVLVTIVKKERIVLAVVLNEP